MIAKYRINKMVFLFFWGAILIVGTSSLSYAELFLSPDIPVTIESDSFKERDILYYEPSSFSLYLSGSTMGISKGANIDAFGFSDSNVIFSLDTPATLDGVSYTERDLILYDGTDFSKLLDGSEIGIPNGACIDAATLLSDGSIAFSSDIPVSLGGIPFKALDLIRYDGSSFSLYFSGLDNGIPENANIDGVYVSPDETEILFSLDIPCSLNGLKVKDKDIIKWSEGYFSLYLDGLSAGIPEGSDVDAIGLEIKGDLDSDWDIDGSDLATFAAAYAAGNPKADLNKDGKVNVDDLAVFGADFGRTDYP